jgi:hypothetical protein
MNDLKNIDDRPFPLMRPNAAVGLPASLLVAAGALAFWIVGRGRTPDSLGVLALVCGVPVLAGTAWMIRRRSYQGIFLTGQLLLIVLQTSGGFRGAPFAFGAVPILAGAMMLWGLFGMARKADELERQVLKSALSVATAIAACAMLAYTAAEALGAPRAPAMLWFEILVIAMYAGLAIAGRRYS